MAFDIVDDLFNVKTEKNKQSTTLPPPVRSALSECNSASEEWQVVAVEWRRRHPGRADAGLELGLGRPMDVSAKNIPFLVLPGAFGVPIHCTYLLLTFIFFHVRVFLRLAFLLVGRWRKALPVAFGEAWRLRCNKPEITGSGCWQDLWSPFSPFGYRFGGRCFSSIARHSVITRMFPGIGNKWDLIF